MSKDGQNDVHVNVTKPTNNGTTLRATVDDELDRIGKGGPWVW